MLYSQMPNQAFHSSASLQVVRQFLREFREDAGVQKKAIYNAAELHLAAA